ncbi:MAG TPA: cation:proton antiporter [Dehalococcoidia bacterium]|nr:cation:proton antiporter [Dehalococcoidia bacterium]
MGHHDLLVDLVVAVALAMVGGWIAARIGLSSIIGYIVAGLVISPFTPGFAGNLDQLRLVAEIGVVLLLFSIGVHFSFEDLRSVRPAIAAAAVVQVTSVAAAGFAIGAVAGWGRDQSLFAGAAIAISSSAVIVKLLSDRNDIESERGQLAVAWSIVEDLCAVVAVAVLVAVTGEGGVAASVGIASAKAIGFVAVALVLGIRVIPWVLERMAEVAPSEVFILGITVLALGMALGSERVGLSIAFGAFLAGMMVSESNVSHEILEKLLPARDVFAALFFVSVGMLIDPSVIRDNIAIAVGLLAAMVVLKGVVTWVLLRLVGYQSDSAARIAALLSQAGEFSFVVAGIGLDRRVVDSDIFSLVVAATAISMALTPGLTLLVNRRTGLDSQVLARSA